MKIKVSLAFSNSLFADGIGRLLAGDPDLEVSAVIDPGHVCSRSDLEKWHDSVILTDFISLYNSLSEAAGDGKKHHILLVDTCCGRENLVSAVLHKKISGVLMSKSSPALLRKAIKAVHRGEVWLDKSTVKSILHGINAVNGDKNASLSSRERDIVVLIGKGLRNKEIANRLNISETTVKTHLTRIFQKLNMKARSELISYAIKTDELNQIRPHRGF